MPLPKRSVGTPGQEIEANRLACRKVNRHRRIDFEELRRYQAAQQQQLELSLQDLTKLSEELGLELQVAGQPHAIGARVDHGI
ncbi:hypothetical protein [Rhodoferax antarcticus]|uniref:hypothetical protein n=1 Tax=Rhodoferax antarcticus TaxID=81479 RepID=UPI0022255305|nr:hypothetical protein [Rhodoferax antarcticus]MCW2312220.1 hypothetical protein [Rhodoferax antarcticus]